MQLSHKLTLTALFGGSSLIALFLFQSFTQNYFAQRNAFALKFKAIETAHNQLDYQILNNAFFLYTNQDSVNHGIDALTQKIDELIHSPHIREEHPQTLRALQAHRDLVSRKIEAIYDFQTTNIVIKNTTAALVASQNRLFEHLRDTDPRDAEVFYNFNALIGSILLAKSGLDKELISALESKIHALALHRFENEVDQKLSERMLSHFQIIERYFPLFVSTMTQIKNPELIGSLQNAEERFIEESNKKLTIVSYFTYLLTTLFMISIGIITFFLFQSERESRRDRLTGLRNRNAYEEDLRKKGDKAALILININKFKHYNDFYGVHEGDRLLIETAHKIRSIPFSGNRPLYYRLGADDFGILFDHPSDENLFAVAKSFLDAFNETPIFIDNEVRTPGLSVSASHIAPVLETADMALKNKSHANPILYHEGLNLHQIISDNVTKAKELKEALEKGRVIPYYQPIVNLSDHQIIKHEVLARVWISDHEVRSIFPYLRIAKESNLYPELTRTILTQSFAVIAEHGGDFSINLTIDDIINEETVSILISLLERYEGIGKQIIFEILESEAIEKYDNITRFITDVRRYGCRIAIDDFGSGYSNFVRILNLAIDIIKIDGSLIRHLDTDEKAMTIVETIVDFAHKTSIETIAEFVHNEAIAQIVRNLGIDGAQGFYFYEPASEPIDIRA
jgi:diguanylate cyclase (GGDEF)-like protein